MTVPSLGKLVDGDLRQAWDHEAHSFTPWVADNLDALADVIGIPLELEGREVAVDEFSADILARNSQTDEVVLIENQLETTDHSHLGQIMSYLAGLDARVVIWIAAGFREAHLSAVRWLNEHTDQSFAFFAIQVRVVRIGDSPLAPIFDVLARPNQWERRLQTIAQESRSASGLGQFRMDFWSHYLNSFPEDALDGPVNGASNRWREIPELDIVISYYVRQDSVGLFIRGPRGSDRSGAYAMLAPHAAQLREILGTELGAPEGYYLFQLSHRADTTDRSLWDKLAAWLHEQLMLYTDTLRELSKTHGT